MRKQHTSPQDTEPTNGRAHTVRNSNRSNASNVGDSISKITVSGFKSIGTQQSITIAPLTVLAGANSSGKSSIMQPLLLLKQTLEVPYDPGALLLNGPNAKFTSVEQLLSRNQTEAKSRSFEIGVGITSDVKDGQGNALSIEESLSLQFCNSRNEKNVGLSIEQMSYTQGAASATLRTDMSHDELRQNVWPTSLWQDLFKRFEEQSKVPIFRLQVFRDRCFLERGFAISGDKPLDIADSEIINTSDNVKADVEKCLRYLIHLPGLRGNPQRTYPVTAVGSTFSGTFEPYTASILSQWQSDKNNAIEAVSLDLQELGLTSKVTARRLNDTQVELRVGRFVKGNSRDLVSVADVGFGVSQTLPVVVALHAARPGQLVYLEQPEIHLHPRAQVAMATVLARAAKRGVRVVVETHSSLLLLGLQTLVADNILQPEAIALHWFEKERKTGFTKVTSATLDEAGTFGDWPEDFDDVYLAAQSRYLDASEFRLSLHSK